MTIILFDNKPKRREKQVILAEIAGIAKKGASKTHIMYKANLSFSQLKLYLSFLLQSGLLEKFEQNKRAVYKTTQKGLKFLEGQKKVMDMLSEDAHSPAKSEGPVTE